ncbi:glycosyltransferase family 2 protein [Rothia sp. P5764]|uniref:glycosyltransferase family 2 protein n=1 Tax=Rothia sp. P5764 TaxID=3402654 RepID=UPI003ACE847E
MPKVAIIVRTKDRPLFLRRALANIAEQTYTDYTVAIVNDGGDREVVEQLVAQAQGLSGIQILHTGSSKGMEAASNLGIKATESTYIAIHDDDDLWEPTFLETTVAALEETDGQLVTVRTDEYFERITDQGTLEFIESRPFWGFLNDITIQDLMRINRAVPISILYRRSLHEELGYYDESLPVTGDWEFNIRVASRYPVHFIDQNLAHWSKRPQADGSNANSVYAGQILHNIFDGRVRARAIREDLSQQGRLGSYLFQAHLANQVDGRVGHNIDLTNSVLDELAAINSKLDRLEETSRATAEQLNRIERALSLKSRLARLVKGNR